MQRLSVITRNESGTVLAVPTSVLSHDVATNHILRLKGHIQDRCRTSKRYICNHPILFSAPIPIRFQLETFSDRRSSFLLLATILGKAELCRACAAPDFAACFLAVRMKYTAVLHGRSLQPATSNQWHECLHHITSCLFLQHLN